MLTLHSFLPGDDRREIKSLMRVRKLGTMVFAGVMTAAAALICIGSDYGMAMETVTAGETLHGEERNSTKAKIQLGFETMASSIDELSSSITSDKIGMDPKTQEVTKQISVKVKEKAKVAVSNITVLGEKDYRNLLQIVEAEAGGEDIEGRILVANVILNRVDSKSFPNNVTDVIYQRKGSHVQFSPVGDGRIRTVTPSEGTKSAVRRALAGEDRSKGALYFSAREAADPNSMRWFDRSLNWLFRHGHHEFYK